MAINNVVCAFVHSLNPLIRTVLGNGSRKPIYIRLWWGVALGLVFPTGEFR
jgi:hypothetical protein